MKMLKPKKFKIKKIVKDQKTIRVIEKGEKFDFSFQRNYIINNHNINNFSGFHAHKKLYQLVFCIRGKVKIVLDDKISSFSYELDNPDFAVIIPPGYWRILKLSKNSIVSVLASSVFHRNDYIKNYDKLKNHKKIDFNGVEECNNILKNKFINLLDSSLRENQLVLGKSVDKFEKKFSSFINSKFSISCGNGHDAILLILRALNISKNHEVLVPSNSFIASALAVTNAGADVKFVDCNSEDYGVCIDDLKKKITKKTKALIVVHLYGIPDNIEKLVEFCRKNKIYLIEDSSQAHGAKVGPKKIGNFGIASAFSFYPTKNLGALGDGGCITTNSFKLYSKLKALRNYGKNENSNFKFLGVNSRLDSIQAEFLIQKLRYIENWNTKRSNIANCYFEGLKNINEIVLPSYSKNIKPVWHIFPIRCLTKRNQLINYLRNYGIETAIHYEIPIHKTNVYKSKLKLSNSERNGKQLISLPMHPFLSKKDINYITSKINKFYKN